MNAETEMAGADGLGADPPKGAPCPVEGCDGTIQASGRVYFYVTRLEGAEGEQEIADMEFSAINDSYDGHPCALEAELSVYCSNDHELDYPVGGRAQERTNLHGLSV